MIKTPLVVREYIVDWVRAEIHAHQDSFYNSGVFCCMREKNGENPINNHLMWGHYGDGLKGFVIEVDSEELPNTLPFISDSMSLTEVLYKDKPPVINPIDYLIKKTESEEMKVQELTKIIGDIMSTKNTHWEYENEVRFINHNKGNVLIPYREKSLKTIILGSKMPRWQQDTLKSITKNIGVERIGIASINPRDYSLDINYSIV